LEKHEGLRIRPLDPEEQILAACAMVTFVVGIVLTWQANRRIGQLAQDQLMAMGRDSGANLASQAEQAVMLGNTAA